MHPLQMYGVFQELPGAAVLTLPNSSDGQTDTSRPIKEGRASCAPPAVGTALLRGVLGMLRGIPPGSEIWRRTRAALSPFLPQAESPERGSPPPGQPPPRVAVQPGTLCDLLASTAVKLCLGQDGVRMAFAPVSPANVSPGAGRDPPPPKLFSNPGGDKVG